MRYCLLVWSENGEGFEYVESPLSLTKKPGSFRVKFFVSFGMESDSLDSLFKLTVKLGNSHRGKKFSYVSLCIFALELLLLFCKKCLG